MKKRIKALFMALVMILSTVFMSVADITVAKADGGFTVRFHYKRTDGDYKDWNMWIWGAGDGTANEFTGEDDFGKYLDYNAEAGNTQLGYIVRKGEWVEKDPDLDRFLDVSAVISGRVDVYLTTGISKAEEDFTNAVLGCKVKSAESKDGNTVNVEFTAKPEVDLNSTLTVEGTDGQAIAIKSITGDNTSYVITLSEKLNMSKTYNVKFEGNIFGIKMPDFYSSDEFEAQYTYDGDDLGSTWSKEKTTFKLWAPTAEAVSVNLYETGTKGAKDLIKTVEMTKTEKGVWALDIEGDLNKTYYTYTVNVGGATNETIDPYAKAAGVNGDRGMIIDLASTNPEGWEKDKNPNSGLSYTDMVIYELHVRDFSYDASSGMKNVGKYLAFTEMGTKNSAGQSTGVDYLKDLGITHLHILPSYDYATVNENTLDKDQFNWGYDPKNYNIPEGSYSTDPFNGEVRINEYKQMVQSLHNNGISVVMDVVYNHTNSSSDFSYSLVVPGYFHRPDSNGSGCGNDVASERSMVKKYIVESVLYWAKEYHIDGFRFDLVGLIDVDTINEIVEELHAIDPSILLYGEGWSIATKVTKEDVDLATQGSAILTPGFGYFNDAIRDDIKGSVFGAEEPGYVNGKPSKAGALLASISGAPVWATAPTQTINYASCHDNLSLFDKLQSTCPDASFDDLLKMNSLTAAIVLTSQGVPFFQAGEEILRTKVKADGTFDHNSYASPSSLNSLKWDDLSKDGYKKSYEYYKGLIEFRKNHSGLRMTTDTEVYENMKVLMDGENDLNVIQYLIDGKANNEVSDGIVVVFNPSKEATTVSLPDGEWKVCVNGEKAGTEVLATANGSVEVAPVSAMVLVNGATKLSAAGDNNSGTNDDTTNDTTANGDTNSNGTSTTEKTTSKDQSVQTGDNSSTAILVTVIACMAVVLGMTVMAKKRKEN